MQTQKFNSKPLSVSINEACKTINIGRTKLYELINSGTIKTIKIGRKTLVVYSSLENLVGGSGE